MAAVAAEEAGKNNGLRERVPACLADHRWRLDRLSSSYHLLLSECGSCHQSGPPRCAWPPLRINLEKRYPGALFFFFLVIFLKEGCPKCLMVFKQNKDGSHTLERQPWRFHPISSNRSVLI